MKEKKSEVITFRTEPWVKNQLEQVAMQNQWTIAQTVNQLCMNFLVEPRPNMITVKTEEFVKLAIEARREGLKTGIELSIETVWNKEKENYEKELSATVIESGGLGAINGFDALKEMTEDEILEIP